MSYGQCSQPGEGAVQRDYGTHRVPELLSLRRNGVLPPPKPQASVYPPLETKGGATLAGDGWSDPIRTTGKTALQTVYSVL